MLEQVVKSIGRQLPPIFLRHGRLRTFDVRTGLIRRKNRLIIGRYFFRVFWTLWLPYVNLTCV